ncbi:unnamed protein product [Paramecium octaurelia]|uniref:Uncharacterized protein n=1 Tax=Paramecium octaurelia TaxID=43137 RepID=A0A8S1V6L9_PAROT|nr:unnamed protein product [Paramecium octaurelia]
MIIEFVLCKRIVKKKNNFKRYLNQECQIIKTNSKKSTLNQVFW